MTNQKIRTCCLNGINQLKKVQLYHDDLGLDNDDGPSVAKIDENACRCATFSQLVRD